MAVHIRNLSEFLKALPQCSDTNLVVLCFYTPNELSTNLFEFYQEIIENYQVSVFFISSEDSTEVLFKHYKINKVPMNFLLIGLKPVQVVEGTDIPMLFQSIEKYSSSFESNLEQARKEQTEYLNSLIHTPLCVFLKGTQSQPKSRRSKKIVRILNGYLYDSYDISTDIELLESLKKLTNSTVFPQYFVNGNFCGSLEQLVESTQNGSLSKQIGGDLNTRLLKLINSHKCIVVMMGSKEEPICGFSKRLIALFAEYSLDYDSFDISIDAEVCEGLKVLSNWPTFPQVYVHGELIGGLDICMQMHTEGTLKEALGLN